MSAVPALRTRLCELVGVEHPIVQTGMGWVAYPSLVAATSAAGGLGILASATMDIVELRSFGVALSERADHARVSWTRRPVHR